MKENAMTKIAKPTRRSFLTNASALSLVTMTGTVSTFAAQETSKDMNDKYEFGEVFNRIGVNSVKWDGAINKYGKNKVVVPMTIADMDFKQMPAVTKALMERVQYEGYGYEMVGESYYQSIIDWQRNQHGLYLKKEWIRNTSGLTAALVPALRALNLAGGKVLVMPPTYNGFMQKIKKIGMRVEMSPMKRDGNGWQMDLEDLERRIDDETKCLILCNPNNPTGDCWTADELRALGDVCIRHGVTILSDEIWADVVRAGEKFTPYASIGQKYATTSITFSSAAKVFNQPMLKVAYFFSHNKELLNAVMKKGAHYDEINTFGIVAAETAYNEGRDWMKDMNQYLDENFDYLEEFINKSGEMAGISFSKPESTYIAWLECSQLMQRIIRKERQLENGSNSNPESIMSEWLMEHAGVRLNPGVNYGIGGEGYLRMSVAVPRKHLVLALNNLNQAIKTL